MHVAKKKTLPRREHVCVVGLTREKRSWGEFWLTNFFCRPDTALLAAAIFPRLAAEEFSGCFISGDQGSLVPRGESVCDSRLRSAQ
jgi:hypothetical protein